MTFWKANSGLIPKQRLEFRYVLSQTPKKRGARAKSVANSDKRNSLFFLYPYKTVGTRVGVSHSLHRCNTIVPELYQHKQKSRLELQGHKVLNEKSKNQNVKYKVH